MPKNDTKEANEIRIALRASEAAKAIGISSRLLATLVAEKRVPHVRINSVLLFPLRELQEWLTSQIDNEDKP